MKDFFKFLISKQFLRQLFFVFLFLTLVLFGVLMWLKSYTNHGQQLELSDYVNVHIDKARDDAESKTFEIIVTDSIHEVGKPGGYIIDQNPEAGSKVKENRKIYVNVTKYNPDQIKVADLPILYGNDYSQKKTELKYLDISCAIKSEKYDPGEPNHILEVWYKGVKIIDRDIIKKNTSINKGGELSFVISKREGGSGLIPDLTCIEFAAAETKALLSKFQIGNVKEVGKITDRNTAYIISQSPRSDGSSTIPHNSSISVAISQDRPKDCQ